MPGFNENVEIILLPGIAAPSYSGLEETRAKEIVRRSLLLESDESYLKVFVAISEEPAGNTKFLDVTMLRSRTFTADFARLVADHEFNLVSVDRAFVPDDERRAAMRSVMDRREPESSAPDMVFGTPVPEIPTALAGINLACAVAQAAGYTVVRLLGADASVANYKHYLTSRLKAFGSIGHGYTGGIVLSDGNLTSTWVSGLARNALSPEVIYFNSCQVFNPPLQPSIMKAGARTFIGGKVDLLIGPSEEVFKCFWSKVLGPSAAAMGLSLRDCERDHYPTVGAHGISGDVGAF
jgi:hypothetical protein